MPNYKLDIQYDGTNYSGWQIQDNAKTIQGEIEAKLNIILQKKIGIIGSGRTDTGVHAFGQVANFNIDCEIDERRVFNSLNAMLDNDIAIVSIEKVDDNFHSRFDATRRSYLYFLTNAKSPFYNKFMHFYTPINNIDVNKLNKISKSLIGESDFTSFARKKTDLENKKCTIYGIHWRKKNNNLVFFIEANRFLHGMVKTTVGTLIRAYESGMDFSYIEEILNAKDREAAREAFPSKGLFLYKVKYL